MLELMLTQLNCLSDSMICGAGYLFPNEISSNRNNVIAAKHVVK